MMIKLGSKAIDIPAGERNYEITDYVRAAGRRGSAQHLSARALSRQGDAGDGHVPGRRDAAAAAHPALGLSLAAGLSLRRAGDAAARHDARDAVHVRQLGRQHAPAARPAAPVVYGPNSSDEMGDVWLQVLPRSPADAMTLARAGAERETRANIAGAELLVRREPENARNQLFLGEQLRRGRPRCRGDSAPRARAAARSEVGARAQLPRRRAPLLREGAARRSRISGGPRRSIRATSACRSTSATR